MSLKSQLNQIIKDRNGGVVTIDEVQQFCEKGKFKLSNAERRLRPSESPNVKGIYNDKKTAIIGYKWVGDLGERREFKQSHFPSKSDPEKKYQVTDLTTGWDCECSRFRFTGDCVHVKTVKIAMGV